MKYRVNKTSLQYETQNQAKSGEDIVLLQKAIDLSAKKSWSEMGYTIEKLFDQQVYDDFRNATAELLKKRWQKASLIIPENFELHQYHKVVPTQEQHLAAVEQTKIVDVKFFPIAIDMLEKRISEICQENLIVRNPFDEQSVFHFRVIRPQHQDNNPLHRDVWLKDYRDCINLYIPIAGSDENSSLIIVPGSHRWSENKIIRTISGAEINGIKYNVPAVTDIVGHSEFVRPNPELNQVLVFSPYLIHGGSVNLNADRTRISIEIRLWKK